MSLWTDIFDLPNVIHVRSANDASRPGQARSRRTSAATVALGIGLLVATGLGRESPSGMASLNTVELRAGSTITDEPASHLRSVKWRDRVLVFEPPLHVAQELLDDVLFLEVPALGISGYGYTVDDATEMLADALVSAWAEYVESDAETMDPSGLALRDALQRAVAEVRHTGAG